VLASGALATHAVLQAFAGLRLPSLSPAPPARRPLRAEGRWNEYTDPYQAQRAINLEEDLDLKGTPFNVPKEEALERDVKVTDVRDLNELLKLPNPMKPSTDIQLWAITLSDGTRIDRPTVKDLKSLNPTSLRPVTFHWRDKSPVQTNAPTQYDEYIQRLLNAGEAEMEELVRANWKKFDKAFFFRLTELKQDTNDARLKEKFTNLERMALDIVEAAQTQARKSLPEHATDAKDILNSMLEEDQTTLLWPPPAKSYTRLAEAITLRAVRANYDDLWFEDVLEVCERFGKKMEVQQKTQLCGMSQIVMQRLITEWLRHDSLWEETSEGMFIARLMNITHDQWPSQLFYETAPLDTLKLRDELKIVSENKVVALPMGSKLQVYAAKYLQGLVEFITKKDEIIAERESQMRAR